MQDALIDQADWDLLWNSIDWPTHGRSFKALPHGKQRWLTKHASGHCGVGRMLVRYKWQTHSDCPHCGQTDESTVHILQCGCQRATAQWTECLESFSTWMQKNYTDPVLEKWILLGLQQWRTSSPPTHVAAMPHIRQAIMDQDKLGWWQFLLGRITKSLIQAQSNYITRRHPRRHIATWSTKFYDQVWTISFTMWDHRNTALHGTELTPTKVLELAAFRAEIRAQFAMDPTTVLAKDKWRLKPESKEWALDLSYDRSTIWLQHIKDSRDAYQAAQDQFANDLTRHQEAMRAWLLTAVNQDDS